VQNRGSGIKKNGKRTSPKTAERKRRLVEQNGMSLSGNGAAERGQADTVDRSAHTFCSCWGGQYKFFNKRKNIIISKVKTIDIDE